jgi:hypothetical protein
MFGGLSPWLLTQLLMTRGRAGGRSEGASPDFVLGHSKDENWETMSLPKFSAEASLGPSRRTYHGKYLFV